MKSRNRRVIGAVIAIAIVALVVWGFLAKRTELAAERDREKPVESPSRVVNENGHTYVAMDAATQTRSGIVVAPLAPSGSAAASLTSQGFGSVVDLQELLDLQNDYVTQQANAEKGRAELEKNRREYERLRILNADNKNVSDKMLEEARAAYETSRANIEAANTSAAIALTKARQRWGAEIGGLVASPGGLARFAPLRDVVVQVSLPPEGPQSLPREITVRSPAGATTTARFLSISPRSDPKTQGRSVYYVAPSLEGAFAPGMNLDVLLPSVRATSAPGVFVPNSAVVWSQGTSFIYVEARPTRFERAALTLSTPAPGGWIVSTLTPGTRAVVRGAQLLLSEEFRSQVKAGEEKG